jgi:hypothetical protein
MIKCNKCESEKVRKEGIRRGKQRFFCNDCRNNFSIPLVELDEKDTDIPEVKENTRPIIAVMDIESLPAISFHWDMYDVNIGKDQIIEDICLLSWAAKILNSTEIYSDILTSEEAKNRDPERIALSAWKFLNSVDIVIGHNWNGYD